MPVTATPSAPEQVKSAKHTPDERYFLEGPRSRKAEFFTILRVLREFIRGFRVLHFVGPCVTVFGSARFAADHPYYKLAEQVGARLGELGFTVMTGGGPGIMEAANRGARAVAALSVGCNITLPREQLPNPYLDVWVEFRYFFVRKVMLMKYSYAFIVMPGGVGTMDELFEALTLIQTKKIKDFPIVVMGRDYWQPLVALLERMVAEKTIDAADTKLLLFTDSVDEAMAHIQGAVERFGLVRRPVLKRAKILGE